MINLIAIYIFFISFLLIFWGAVGYHVSLRIIDIFFDDDQKDTYASHTNTLAVIIPAYNEEKVITEKLINVIEIDYPNDLFEVIVVSDGSTDKTDELVLNFIKNHPKYKIKLMKTNDRKGKTFAQNRAVDATNSEYLIFTDANAIISPKAVNYLIASFDSPEVAYTCGKLVYINSTTNNTAHSENFYWKIELKSRKIESNIQTIVAGNGALYAVRKSDYIYAEPIFGHDSFLPHQLALNGKKAKYNEFALAFEKAGESAKDEFKRKVRMMRNSFSRMKPDFRALNFFKYGWYSYFYLGHRYTRDNLWLFHAYLLISNLFLAFSNSFYFYILLAHLIIYIIGIAQNFIKVDLLFFRIIHYYLLTVFSQAIGVFKQVFKKNKPFWEKAESTR